MSKKSTKESKDSISEGLEGGHLYLPPPPRISLMSDEYTTLMDLLVGDTVDLDITARVTDIDEEGRYGLELMTIKIADKNGVMETGESENIKIGSLSKDTLDRLFGGK